MVISGATGDNRAALVPIRAEVLGALAGAIGLIEQTARARSIRCQDILSAGVGTKIVVSKRRTAAL